MSGGLAQLRAASVGILPALIIRLAGDDLVGVFEEAALRRAGGARAVLVVGAAVAGTEEKLRLREPAHRASEMSAVDGEDLKSVAGDAANPAGNFAGLPIPWGGHGIAEVGQAGFALRKIADRAKVDPRVFAGTLLQRGAQQIAEDGHGQNRTDGAIQAAETA